MSDSSGSSNSGIGLTGMLGVAFVVLKLTHAIDWSWWWVTLPFYGGIVIAIIALLVYLVVKSLD